MYGGLALHDVLVDGEESLARYKANSIKQDSFGKATTAPFIRSQFGEIRFSELTSIEVRTRFNALDGSNTKPRAVFEGQNVYFSGLYDVSSDQFGDTLSEFTHATPGSIVWN